MRQKRTVLWKLFVSTLYLSAFTFGGGYVIVTLMKKKFVDEYHWIEEKEMLDLIAIAQSSPGAVAVNGAIVVSYKLGGNRGDCDGDRRDDHSAVCHYFSDFHLLRGFPQQLCCQSAARRDAGGSGSRHRGCCVGYGRAISCGRNSLLPS